MKEKAKAAATGALAGAINGLLGAGGGMVAVPLLLGWLKLDEEKAFPTCVFIIAPLCAVSAAVYFLRGDSFPMLALPYLLGGFLGGYTGGKTFKKVPLGLLRRAFGVMMIYGGIRAFL